MDPDIEDLSLLDAFRHHYSRIEGAVQEVMYIPTDTTILERINDDLAEYAGLVEEVNKTLKLLCSRKLRIRLHFLLGYSILGSLKPVSFNKSETTSL